MAHPSLLHADDFLQALHKKLRRVPKATVNRASLGAKAWSRLMFDVFQGAATECEMESYAARNKRGPKYARREHLFDITWFRRDCGDWETPELILEHENQHNRVEFLKDFWKLMVGYAPIRVMVGYCQKESDRNSWIAEVNRIIDESRIRFPNTVDDVILLGHGGMKITDFAVYRRHETKFQQTVDSLDVIMPDPKDTEAWSEYIRNMQIDMAKRVHVEVARLESLGIIDSQGHLLIKTLPPDMAPGAETSVITG